MVGCGVSSKSRTDTGQGAGIKPDDPLLANIKTYAKFPKDEPWLRRTMEKILLEN